MKILFLSHQAEYIYGGEICTLELIRRLSSDHQVHFAAPSGPYTDKVRALTKYIYEIPSVEFSRKLNQITNLLPALWNTNSALLDYISREQIELLHATSLKSMVYAWLVGARRRVPVLWHHHDILPEKQSNDRWAQAIAIGAKTIVTPSEATRQALLDSGVKATKVVTIPNGFAPERWRARGERSANDKFRLAYVGEISARKGVDLFPELLKKLNEESPGQYELMVIGEGLSDPEFAAKFKNDMAPWVAQGQAHLLGRREDVPDLLQFVDCLLVPSRQDPLPTVIIEAFFSAVPVCASSVGGIPEMVRPGENGYLCDSLDEYVVKLEKMRKRPVHWLLLSTNAREFASRNHDGAIMTRRFVEQYQNLIAPQPPK